MIVCFILLCLNDVQYTPSVPGQVISMMKPFHKYFSEFTPTEYTPYLLLFDFNVPSFVPVLFGIFTPVSFMANGLFTNHLVGDNGIKHPFDTNQLQFSSLFVVHFIIIIAAIFYWANQIFS